MGPADRSQYKCPTSRQEGEECFLGFHTKNISLKVSEVCKNLLSHYSIFVNMLRKMMKTLFALCFMVLMAFVTVEAAVR